MKAVPMMKFENICFLAGMTILTLAALFASAVWGHDGPLDAQNLLLLTLSMMGLGLGTALTILSLTPADEV